ncbi:MAG TPA: hypothetical protein VF753_07590 [Terriglobales bacterium]
MDIVLRPGKVTSFLLVCLLNLFLFASQGRTQAAPAQSTPAAPTGQQPPANSPATDGKNPLPRPQQPEKKISPKDAEALFQSVDQILKFVSEDTGLPIKSEVKRRLASREEVVAYLEKSMSEDKDAKRLQRSELVLKKFGLLPQDFDLKTFLVSLLREQVAGYYDPKTKTVNLLDWLDADEQKPVLAHELTHALQDQSFDLRKWMREDDPSEIDDIENPTWADFAGDEMDTAREAVVEGQAMVPLMDYMLAPVGKSLASSPELARYMVDAMLNGEQDLPEFKSAPIFLQESLTFPYRYGMEFTAELLKAGGKEMAFAGAFARPPENSRQVMEPKTYLSNEHLAPLPLPDYKADFKNYDRFDIGAIGEFDVAVLIEQYAGRDASQAMYPAWRGGYYYAVRSKGNTAAPLAVVFLSRWADAASAGKFAAIYVGGLPARYKQVSGADDPASKPLIKAQLPPSLEGTHRFKTEQGDVVLEVKDNNVLITESLDSDTTERLEQNLLASAPAAAK